ncbi:FAD-binding oxidoreductase [Cupriavidus consociatus]|uniref:FAD-binding oxidoreductase n=1 Tax=Cupriavidus consociatus TaxID=2821357 RepID=UPI001AE867E0|nr:MULTISPECIES: FAD-binding oxidoreductase [unclassified Cupriavidus]MBP0620819.1 2Fe-2S iron-sulfur cluster binding domain-containing protein [Cupriavidus sp. LEh25]MDK2657479.1 FAD-binding oxidoreductase [Cupriavidus sp. LEh21]
MLNDHILERPDMANDIAPAAASTTAAGEDGSPHRVVFLPKGAAVSCEAGQSILDAALHAGFFPKHSCRRGECHACAANIVSGSVSYPSGFVPEGLPPGQCLTCMARPEDDLVIEAPEVAAVPGRRVVQAGARVLTAQRVSHDVTIVRLQVPPAADFAFEAGQYCDVVLRDGSRRSYSMANAPDGTGVIEWHVRALPRGRFSTHVYSALKPRDMLRVEGPYGAFTLSDTGKPVVLLASGTGYAPIAAILKTHADALRARGAVLYWGGRRLEDLYAFEEARAWQQESDRLRFVPVLSEPDGEWTGRTGFVHEAVAEDLPNMAGVEVYACGNPLMVDGARACFVQEHALPEDAFFSDAFITSLTPQGAT